MKLLSTHLTRRPISWSAVLAGGIATIALLSLWLLLGGAIGLWAAPSGGEMTGWIAGGAAWFFAGVCLAVCAGAYIAGHWCNGALDRDGAVNGLMSWAVSFFIMLVLGIGGAGVSAAGILGKARASQAPMISGRAEKVAADEYAALQNPGFQAWLKARARGEAGGTEKRRPAEEKSMISFVQEQPARTSDVSSKDEPLVIFLVNEADISWSQASTFVRTHRSEIDEQIRKTKDAATQASQIAAWTTAYMFVLGIVSLVLAMIVGRAGLQRAAETPVAVEAPLTAATTVHTVEPPPATGTTPAPGAPTV
jgi:hypothetical protein